MDKLPPDPFFETQFRIEIENLGVRYPNEKTIIKLVGEELSYTEAKHRVDNDDTEYEVYIISDNGQINKGLGFLTQGVSNLNYLLIPKRKDEIIRQYVDDLFADLRLDGLGVFENAPNHHTKPEGSHDLENNILAGISGGMESRNPGYQSREEAIASVVYVLRNRLAKGPMAQDKIDYKYLVEIITEKLAQYYDKS